MEGTRVAKLGRALAAVVFAGQFVALDLTFRGTGAWPRPATAVLSVLVWSLGLAVATTRARRAVVALAAGSLLVLQAQVFRYYHAPLDVQVAASALHSWGDIRPVIVRAVPWILGAALVAAGLEYLVLRAASPSPRIPARYLAVAVGVGLFVLPLRGGTPDLSGLHALVALVDRPASAAVTREALPPLHVDRAELPHVLFVLSESVRAEDYDGAIAKETAAATPSRVDLREMRSVASYTALSFSALVRGRTQLGSREAVLRAPSLFDFARAARDGQGRRPTVIYASAQSLAVLEPPELRASIDKIATSETLLGTDGEQDDPRASEGGVDGILADHFASELRATSGAVVAVLHLTDTHAPYAIDPANAPFQPADHLVAWSKMGPLHNAYKDAIVLQDRAVARAVRAFVDHAGKSPWLVVFTSDHGEAFGEHGAIHHGQNFFDEQVHVPAWIAAGSGTLSAEQAGALADHAGRFVTHLDLLPTMLDALGLLDNSAVAPHRAGMPGRSLLRPWQARAPIPVTNCTLMFPCPTNTWGLYEGDHKLVARIYDASWACLVVGGGGERLADPSDPACERLRTASREPFPLLPNGTPNR